MERTFRDYLWLKPIAVPVIGLGSSQIFDTRPLVKLVAIWLIAAGLILFILFRCLILNSVRGPTSIVITSAQSSELEKVTPRKS